MAAPAQINTLRLQDFPKGLADQGATDRLFQILNPFLQQVQGVTTAGTSLGQNVDGQLVTLRLTTPATAWTEVPSASLLHSWAQFAAVGSPNNLSYRVDQYGVAWLRGIVKTGTTAASDIMVLPAALWPAATTRWATGVQGAAGIEVYGRLDVAANGTLTLQASGAAAAPYAFALVDHSWPTATGAPGALSCFPLNVRLKDGKRPAFVVAQASPSAGQVVCVLPSYTYLGAGPTGNLLQVTNIPGLTLGTSYTVQLFVFF